jgi:hypothetical protein
MVDESGLQQSEMLTPKITCLDKKIKAITLYIPRVSCLAELAQEQ